MYMFHTYVLTMVKISLSSVNRLYFHTKSLNFMTAYKNTTQIHTHAHTHTHSQTHACAYKPTLYTNLHKNTNRRVALSDILPLCTSVLLLYHLHGCMIQHKIEYFQQLNKCSNSMHTYVHHICDQLSNQLNVTATRSTTYV